MQTHTITVRTVTTVEDTVGNITETDSTDTVDGLLYAPEGLTESTDPNNPQVIGEATLYGTLPARLDADDTITHGSGCCDGTDFPHGPWQVVGGSKGWGDGDAAIPIRRTGAT